MKAPVATSAAPLMEKAESTSPVEPDVLVAPFFSVIAALDNKKKYLVARAEKLRKFDEDAKYGKKLTEDKEKARLCLPDVKNQIGFIDTIQKKVMEKQREFNKKTKQRNYAAKQENDQICGKVAIEALTARYLLGQYLGAGEESQLLKSFNTDDRVNLKSVARFFLPEKFPSSPVTRFSAFIEKHKTEIDTILSRKTNYYLWDDFNGNDAYRLLEKLAKVLENLEEERVSGQKVDRLGSNNINDEAETPVSSSPAEPDFKAPAPSNTPVELVYAPDGPKPLKNGDGKITFGYFSDSSRQSTPPSAPLVTQRAADTNAEKPVVADGEKPEAGEKTERKRPPRRPRSQRKSKTSEGVDPAFENGTVAVPKPKTERPPKLDKDGEKISAAPRSKGAPRGGKYNNGQRRTDGPRENRENGTGHKQAYFAENGTRAPRKAYNDENETRAPRYNKNYQGTSIDQKTGYYKAHNNREYARESYYRNEYTVPEGYVRRGDYVRPLDSSTCGFTLKVQQ